jgi:antitoxin component YwqK of YwqJK toxin-antitoxin module
MMELRNGHNVGKSYFFYPDGTIQRIDEWAENGILKLSNEFYDSDTWALKTVIMYDEKGTITSKKEIPK